MNDKKIELISAKGAMGVTEFALLYFPESPPETAYKRMWVMDTDFAWSERKTFGCGMGEIPETLYAEAGRLPG